MKIQGGELFLEVYWWNHTTVGPSARALVQIVVGCDESVRPPNT